MMTLPQINLFTHGTQWTVSHGHFAFWGAYGCGIIAVIYLALQKARDAQQLDSTAWKWSFALLNLGMVGMVGALLVSGIAQAFYERAMGGSTLQAFMEAQTNVWFVQGIVMRLVFGLVFAVGYVILIVDLLAIGRKRVATENFKARAAGGPA
jgi:nitric oxide reductase subunit B